MKEIQLTKGRVSLVDDEDFEMLNKHKWICQTTPNGFEYAARRTNGAILLMHRFLLNPSKGFIVDHANGDTLDNRRSNIRIATQSQNRMNARIRNDNTHGERGIIFEKRPRKNPWYAVIQLHGKKISLGAFPTKEMAVVARRNATERFFGDFSFSARRLSKSA